MQSGDGDTSPSVNTQRTIDGARVLLDSTITNVGGSGRASPRSPLQVSTEDPDSTAVQAMDNSDSPDLTDSFSRLQQIQSALSYLEESLVRADSTEAQVTTSTPQDSTSSTETGIGPSHSAILLSEEDSSLPQSGSLHERLSHVERSFPQYMFASADLVRRRQQNQQGPTQTPDTRNSSGLPGGSTSLSRQPDNTTAVLPRNRTSDAAPGRTIPPRPVRDLNRSTGGTVGLLRPETRPVPELNTTHTLPAWRTAYRDDDSPSTLLGRRVASRAAARAAGNSTSTSEPRRRAIPSSTLFWQGPSEQSSVVLPRPTRAGASRVVVPARVPDRVSRRIAQFESTAIERQLREDSDGSETEVQDHYVYRPPVIRARTIPLQRASERGQTVNPPQPAAITPSSPFGPAPSTGQSSSDFLSPQPTEGERPAAVSDRMQNVYGHLQRLSATLLDATSSRSPSSSSTDGGDLDGALFSRAAARRRGGEDLYHEVIDEEEGRSYRILRRLNGDGDEQVHQLNSDPWMEPTFVSEAMAAFRSSVAGETERRVLSAAQAGATNSSNGASAGSSANVVPPAVERLRRIFQTVRPNQQSETDLPPLITDSPSQNTNMATRRRRGWARLDANGDEIPTDEEEEIDRVLTAQRIRSSQGAAWRTSTNATPSSSTIRTRLEYLTPTTRSVFSHATDEDEDEENTSSDIRVRLNLSSALAPRRFTGPTPRFNVFSDAWKEKEKEREPEQEFFGTSEPYVVSPVPIPFEEMVPSGGSRSESYNPRRSAEELREKVVAGL